MDPNTCYLDMYAAMKNGEHEEAREHAFTLKDWIGKSGFHPVHYTRVEVCAYIANVLRRTVYLYMEGSVDR